MLDLLDLLYYNSLMIGWAMLILFAVVLYFGKVPQTENYRAYNKTRKIIAAALFFWGIQILLQWTFNFREEARYIATALNIPCYYLGGILFGMGYISLLDSHYISRRQLRSDFTKWGALFVVVWSAVLFLQGAARFAALVLAAMFFLADILRIITIFFRTYRRAVREIENYDSENTEAFIRWLYRSVLGVVFFGSIGAVMAFAPKWAVGIYMTAGIGMFGYIFFSLLNYSLNCESVSNAVAEIEIPEKAENDSGHNRFEQKLEEWIAQRGYRQHGVTIAQLAEEFGSNRNALSEYYNRTLHCSFREWINDLRMSDAKHMLLDNQNLTVDEVAQNAGFSGKSYFSTIFKQREEMTPTEWRTHHKQAQTSDNAATE